MTSLKVHYSDGLPSAIARRGVVRLALRASDIDGAEHVVCEVAMSPHIASLVIMALTNAIADHNGAEACSVYAFSGRKRRTRSKPQR